MKVYEEYVHNFLEGRNKSFVIPVYQRDYAWKTANCQQLWDDIKELIKKVSTGKTNNHFLGTIVTISDDEAPNTYSVIDGQQRLTTISILLIALSHYISKQNTLAEDEKYLCEDIQDYLINKRKQNDGNDKRIRLKPNKNDKIHFNNLFQQKNITDNQSNIINNYRFFINAMEQDNILPSKIFDAFQKLVIVYINLNRQNDNPQLIFEGINSTGVSLTAADLIRNYILMELDVETQERMYEKYWVEIEKLTASDASGSNLSNFIRHYLTLKTQTIVKQNTVYETFKKYTRENFEKREDILNDLLYFAEIYYYFIGENHDDTEINQRLRNFRTLDNTTPYPYFLAIFNELQKDELSIETVREILVVLESVIFRKIVTSSATHGWNKVFPFLHKNIENEIKKSVGNYSYLEVFKFILLRKTGSSSKFPTDEEFQHALTYNDVYKAKYTDFLLEKLEHSASAYRVMMEDLTIEHIMPQEIFSDKDKAKEWRKALGENWQDIHQKYLHTLGNLSLTSQNAKLSNKTIEEKQAIDFQTSKLVLYYKVADVTQWNGDTIEERGKYWAEKALKIWAYPKTNYSSLSKDDEIYDLQNAEENDFTGLKPKTVSVVEKDYQIESWKDFLLIICQYLYEYSPTEFNYLMSNSELKSEFSNQENNEHIRGRFHEFEKGKFVNSNRNANAIIKFANNLCERLNYPAENIEFIAGKNNSE